MRLQQRWASILSGVGTILAICLSGCTRNATDSYQGYIEAKFVYVASPQAGRLDHLAVARGATIGDSQPLFTLDPEPESSAALQARELLHSDENRLADLKTGKRKPEKDVIEAQLAEAKIEHQKAVYILKSEEQQYATGGLPLTDLISARASLESTSALVRQYQSNLEVAELPSRDAQIEAQADVVATDKAALRQATWKLQQKQVTSARSGLVFDTLYREGEWVPSGSPIVQLLPPENIEVRFFVPETIVGKLKLNQTVSVHCDGCEASVPATITFISTQVEYTPPVIYSNESRGKLVLMIIAKPNPDKAALLHPGQPVEITLQ
jgi:HlyD family secretion protein